MLKNRLIIAGLMACLILAAIPSVLSAADNQGIVPTTSSMKTAPTSVPVSVSDSPVDTAAVTSNIATKYWLELKAYPSSNTRAMWLYAGNDWRYLPSPSVNIETSLQQAFANPDIFQVKVWYCGNKIVGLVVNTK